MTASKKRPLIRGRTGVATLAVAVGVIALVAVGLVVRGLNAADPLAGESLFTVRHGPLTISVTEAGTISAREQVIVKSRVEGRPTIIYLVDEGVHVNTGDLLVQLDSSGLESDLLDQEIKVQNAQAALIQAQEALAVAKNQAAADIAQAKLDYEFAQQDLVKYKDGEYPMALLEAQNNITLAEQERKQAEQTMIWSEKLFQKDYLSKNELAKDQLAFKRADLEWTLAKREKELLETYTKQREVAQLTSDEKQAEMALERTNRSARADVIKAESDLRAKQLEFNRQSDRFAKIKDQIAKCRITAPTSGMVVYATTGRNRWRNDEPLQEGQEVREREELIKLPTASAMSAEIKIHESSLDKVAVGQPVRVTVDALPGRVFQGRVAKISPLPDAQSVWLNPDLKVYDTVIELEGELSDMRTGMTCEAEIVVDHYADTVYVPVQSVVRVGDDPTVYVREGDRLEPRAITVGLHNNKMVRVLGGLEAGEQVTLTPPLGPAKVNEDFALVLADDVTKHGPSAPRDETTVVAAETGAEAGADVALANSPAQAEAGGASPIDAQPEQARQPSADVKNGS